MDVTDGYLLLKHMPDLIAANYHLTLSIRTLQRWRKKHALALPATAEEFETWFESRINQARAQSLRGKPAFSSRDRAPRARKRRK